MALPLVRRLVPFLISALALAAVFATTDLEAFKGLAQRARWDLLPIIVALQLAIIAAFGWRWQTLIRNRLSWRRSALVTTIGLAGNQVLPLRGGDALRIFLSARGIGAPSVHEGVSAMALEKIFDLLAVAALALASTSAVLRSRAQSAGGVDVVGVAVVILIASAIVLYAARAGWLNRVLRVAARMIRLGPSVYAHLVRPLHYLRQTASPLRLMWLLIETAIMWLLLYVVTYRLIGEAVGVPISVTEAMVLLFAAALGVAVPAAPSALGTYHAAIVSAFVLLGRSTGEGLVFAVAAHGIFFVVSVIAGAAALPWTTGRLAGIAQRG